MSSIESERKGPALIAPRRSLPSTRVLSDTLLGNAKELVIVHNGREYRLRRTQNGKLILTA